MMLLIFKRWSFFLLTKIVKVRGIVHMIQERASSKNATPSENLCSEEGRRDPLSRRRH